jgi:hypothetical protein
MPMDVSRSELVLRVVFPFALLDLVVNCREYEGFLGMVFLWTIPINIIWGIVFIRSMELRWLRILLLVLYIIVIASVVVIPTLRFMGLVNGCS